MLPFQKLQAYALRAVAQFGKTGRQTRAAKRQRSKFYASVWKEAAAALGCDIEALSENVFRISQADVHTRVMLNYTPLDDPVSLRIAGDKSLVHRLLDRENLPTPAYAVFRLDSLQDAKDFLRQHHRCVVKPASGTGAGQGVTTGITSARQLKKAAIRALGYGSELLIEEQIAGENLRLLYLDGELLDAVVRRPPMITGDGHSTIRGLVRKENQRRVDFGHHIAQATLPFDLDMKQTLASQGLGLKTVLAEGQVVQIKTAINDNLAAENHSVTEELSEDLVSIGRRAADVVGLRLAGVDVMTPDYTQPLGDAGGVILEVNSTPGFYFHYGQPNGRGPIAVPILKACLQTAASRLFPFSNPKKTPVSLAKSW